MGYSQAAKANTHQRIINIAARRLREWGFSGIGLADIAAEAGITTGALYRHFKSREELLAEAFHLAAKSLDTWADASPDTRSALGNYLTAAHRDQPDVGCPIVALANEIIQVDPNTREAYTKHVEEILNFLTRLHDHERHPNARAAAILEFSVCVGALAFARAEPDPLASARLLDDVASQLLPRNTDAS